MAGERTLPGLGLTGFWTPGSDDWDAQMDVNLRTLSGITQLAVTSRVAALPGSPTDGDIHLLTATADVNKIAIRDNGSWVTLTPQPGWICFSVADGLHYRFASGAWSPFAAGSATVTVSEETSAFDVTNAMLSGARIVRANFGTDAAITVPSGLTGLEPCTFINSGAGIATLTAGGGVTINSADARFKLRVQYSAATLIRVAADTYTLIGDLSA